MRPLLAVTARMINRNLLEKPRSGRQQQRLILPPPTP
jgi:hypothetical protein